MYLWAKNQVPRSAFLNQALRPAIMVARAANLHRECGDSEGTELPRWSPDRLSL